MRNLFFAAGLSETLFILRKIKRDCTLHLNWPLCYLMYI
jgi:hypothetical protein